METKVCKICEEDKNISEYYYQKKKRKDGTEYLYYNPECKECTKKRSFNWETNNKERFKELRHIRYQNSEEWREMIRLSGKNRRKNGKYGQWQRDNPDRIKEYNIYREMHKKHNISNDEWESCKNYFNYRCCYCGVAIEDHWIMYKGKLINGDFSRDHVDHNGDNDLSNCIPACKVCNSSKRTIDFNDWYNESNPNFTYERLEKINKWLDIEYIKYKEKKLKYSL